MTFVAFLQTSKNGNGSFHAWLLHGNRLEASLQSRILFDVFAVFLQGRGTNAAQLSASQLRLEHVGCVCTAFGLASSHDGVKFINEENDAPFAGRDFLEKSLEAVFEFTAILGPGDHGADIHGHQLLVLDRFWHIATDNAPGQTFHNGGFSHARLTDQHRVVFGAS